MSEFGRGVGGEDTDLLCVEVSALGAPPSLPWVACEVLQELPPGCTMGSANQPHEDFLKSLLLKTDAYRPLHAGLRFMEDPGFLGMRDAVVNWFAKVSSSYHFANETALAALSHFDRFVSVTLDAVTDHMLLQRAAYVALLVASKMGETYPLQMKSLASLTGKMFTPLQVKQLELEMISKLLFRLAPPSADETLHCLATLLFDSWPSSVPVADVISAGACYLKKARARTCWFRHSPYTLAVAALATAYNSLGLGQLRRPLLRECDSRARSVTGRGLDVHGVATCAEAMSIDARAAAEVAAATRVGRGAGGTESPVCSTTAKGGWGSPTGVAQGAALLQEVAFSTVASVPLVEDFSPLPPKTFTPCAVPKATHALGGGGGVGGVGVGIGGGRGGGRGRGGGGRAVVRLPGAPRAPSPGCASLSPRQGRRKRGLHQSSGSCFVPCAQRRRPEDCAGVSRVCDASGGSGGSGGGVKPEIDSRPSEGEDEDYYADCDSGNSSTCSSNSSSSSSQA